MPDSIIYTTIEQQIIKLKKHNLIIEDEDFAFNQLQLCGYSNLIKSYREPYVYLDGKHKLYRNGVSFNQIHSLYTLDKNLRNAVMGSMLDFEENIKEAAADVVASSFGIHPDDYLLFSNYRDRNSRNTRFSLSKILRDMTNTLHTDKDPIHHYSSEHGVVPPWILFKSVYLTTIVNYIKYFKPKEKSQICTLLYDDIGIAPNSKHMLLMDTLFVCQEYRNLVAHGGRTYNYKCNKKVRWNEIFASEMNHDDTVSFSDFLFLLALFKYSEPYDRLNYTLTNELNRHCNMYPQDITYLGQTLNINITKTDNVYISSKSSIYHENEHCSGLISPLEINKDIAISKGYRPCNRCTTR